MILKTIAVLALSAFALSAQTPATSQAPAPVTAPVVTVPSGYTSVPFGTSTQLVPTLATAQAAFVTEIESMPLVPLYNEGATNIAGVIAQFNTLVAGYCGEEPVCGSAAEVTASNAPFIAQLQAAFALVPAAQWNPQTFTATGQYATALQYVNAAAAAPVPTPVVSPSLIVDTNRCVTVTGVTGAPGVECGSMTGITVAQVQALAAPFISAGMTPQYAQGGVMYNIVINTGLMGVSYYFEPVN